MDLCVLIADNDREALAIYSEYLASLGYKVYPAENVSDVRSILNARRIHLAIFDLRLTDDADSADVSGLTLAREITRNIPKLILTKWPTYEAVRTALKLDVGSLPPAVDFLNKNEGLGRLGDAVAEAFSRYVNINRDLIIDFSKAKEITFPSLATLIEPDLEPAHLLDHAAELEDSFRRLFNDKSQISIQGMLWRRDARVALTVISFSADTPGEAVVLVLECNFGIPREPFRYREFGPKAPVRNATLLIGSSETAHFTANAYVLSGIVLEDACSLADIYRAAPQKAFTDAISDLLDNTLAEWHQRKTALSSDQSVEGLYRERLGINQQVLSLSALRERIQAIVRNLATLNSRIELEPRELVLKFGGLSFSYPDPAYVVHQTSPASQPAVLMITPGVLTGDNILVDSNGKTWLTDFADAGMAPALWNYVQLESIIRFDWVENHKLQWLHEMEQCLVEGEFSKFNVGDVEQPLRKALRAIQTIRRLASNLVGNDPTPYHLGVFYHAIKRIADFNPRFRLTPNEIARLGHVLISGAMIAGLIGSERESSEEELEESGLKIDQANRRVSVNGRRVSLSRQSYGLLAALYERPNQLFTRQELGVRTFGEKYDETDSSHINRLNTAIFRLREKIEDDPKHPRLLITEPAGGYRLVVK